MQCPDRFIFGCGNFGGIGSHPRLIGRGDTREAAFAILNTAKKLGITQFDTANTYGGGLSELYLGDWISAQGHDYRPSVQIHSKVGNPHGTRPGQRPLSEEEITHHLETSLKRLKTDYVDVYYIHEPDPKTNLSESTRALVKGIEEGKIRRLGLSNVSLSYVQKFVSALGPTYREYLSGVQNQFNYLTTGDAVALIPYLKSSQIQYAAYSPLAGGLLTGEFDFRQPLPIDCPLQLRLQSGQLNLANDALIKIDQLKSRALQNNRTMPEEALIYLLANKSIDHIVIAPRTARHFESLGFNI